MRPPAFQGYQCHRDEKSGPARGGILSVRRGRRKGLREGGASKGRERGFLEPLEEQRKGDCAPGEGTVQAKQRP